MKCISRSWAFLVFMLTIGLGRFLIMQLKDNTSRKVEFGNLFRRASLDSALKGPPTDTSFCDDFEMDSHFGKNPSFSGKEKVYISGSAAMGLVERMLKDFNSSETNTSIYDTFLSVVGGLSGLNILTFLNEKSLKDLVFFDVNCNALNHAQMVFELIKMSNSPREYVSRWFGRNVSNFEAEAGKSLCLENQIDFLSMPVDWAILNDTKERLSIINQKQLNTFTENIEPYIFLGRNVRKDFHYCRILLPCYGYSDSRLTTGDPRGHTDGTPSTNSLHYGMGWLTSLWTFQHVRRILLNTRIRFKPFDLAAGSLEDLVTFRRSRNLVLHISNVDNFLNPVSWGLKLVHMRASTARHGGRLAVLTDLQMLKHDPSPHYHALVALEPFVRCPYDRLGPCSLVEVVSVIPNGMFEWPRVTVRPATYLRLRKCAASITLLHILLGEGTPAEMWVQVAARAVNMSETVVILEHNGDALDWQKTLPRIRSTSELRTLLAAAVPDVLFRLREEVYAGGPGDPRRNIIWVLDGAYRNPAGRGPECELEL